MKRRDRHLATGIIAAAMALPLLVAAGFRAAADDPKDKASARYEVKGHVLDPDGRPMAGARVYLRPLADGQAERQPRATTGADGRFSLPVARSELPPMPDWFDARQRIQVIAEAPGFGPAWSDAGEGTSGSPAVLRLASDDVPIEGTVADLEGRPVAGAKVRPTMVAAGIPDGLDAFFEMYHADPLMFPHDRRVVRPLPARPPGWPAEILTDDQGRFRLTGVGRERIVTMEVEGPSIETRTIQVLTRRDVDLNRADRSSPRYRMLTEGGYYIPVFYGNRFHHLASPSVPIEVRVVDRDTGRPIEGVDLRAYVRNRDTVGTARTDANGTYRLIGLPTEGKLRVDALPGKGRPYLRQSVERPLRSSEESPVRVDVALRRGVLVRGRIIDRATKQGVRAWASYLPYSENPHASETPQVFGMNDDYDVEPDGSFELVALPGPGVVTARAWEQRYRTSRPEQWGHPTNPHGYYSIANQGSVRARDFDAVVKVDPKPGEAEVRCELVLEPGISIPGRLVDPDGRPVTGATAFGLSALRGGAPAHAPILDGAEFTAIGVDPDHPRLVWFLNRQRTLGRMVMLQGSDAHDPITVTLQPCGTLLGRVLDAEGRPKSNAEVIAVIQHEQFQFGGIGVENVRTDVDGRFRITGVLPGLTYRLGGLDFPAKGAGDITVRIGEIKDLGDLRD
jgi:5-hydroxyisourate hydrolase-like protein (transthyretin family)